MNSIPSAGHQGHALNATTAPAPVLQWLALALLVLAFLTGGSSMEQGWGTRATQWLALPVLWLAVARLLQPPLQRAHVVLLVLALLPPLVIGLQLVLGSSLTPWASGRAVYAWLPPLAAFLAALSLPADSRRIGLRVSRKLEQRAHHVLHLALFRAANADHGLLYLPGGVLKDRQVLIRRRDNRHAARLAELQRRVGVLCHKHLFDGEIVRLELGNNFRDARIDELQARR